MYPICCGIVRQWNERPRSGMGQSNGSKATSKACQLGAKLTVGEGPGSAKVASNDWRTGSVRGRKKCQGESMGRKIAIVGAGAVGGDAGAHMVQAGEDVTFIDPWPEQVGHMRKHGLRVPPAQDIAEFSVSVRALHLTDAQQL